MPQKNMPLKTFISYSWDDNGHIAWVHRLFKRLREQGVDAIFDQSETIGGDSIADFMLREINAADKVIAVCTENYLIKADEGKGGVGYEGSIINAEIAAKVSTKKFIPIIRCKTNTKDLVPIFLRGKKFIDMRVDESFDEKLTELLLSLYDRPLFEKPPLGKRKIPQPLKSCVDGAQGNRQIRFFCWR